jgi:copper chaperone
MRAVTLHIEGMTCGHCLNAVSRALHGVEGATVKSVQIGRAEIEVATEATAAALVAAVAAAGYRATAVAPE